MHLDLICPQAHPISTPIKRLPTDGYQRFVINPLHYVSCSREILEQIQMGRATQKSFFSGQI